MRLALVATLFSAPAVYDIAHCNELGYIMECNAVRVSYLLNLVFLTPGLVTKKGWEG